MSDTIDPDLPKATSIESNSIESNPIEAYAVLDPTKKSFFDMGSALTLPIGMLIYSICQTTQPKYTGFIYMGLLILSILARKFIMNKVDNRMLTPECTNIIGTKGLTSDFFIALYTFLYVISPMIAYNVYNDVLMLITIGSYTLFTIYLKKSCYDKNTFLYDTLLAFVLGISSFFIVLLLNPESFLFSTTLTVDQCPKPSKQKMVCSVHRNGELVKKFSS